MLVTVKLENCLDCHHIGNSGRFTYKGAKNICDHPKVCECVRIIKVLKNENPNCMYIKLEDQCWYWTNRIVSDTIPNWCPLQNGYKY